MTRTVRDAVVDRWDRIPEPEQEGLVKAFGRLYWLLMHDACPETGCLHREGYLCDETYQDRWQRLAAAA